MQICVKKNEVEKKYERKEQNYMSKQVRKENLAARKSDDYIGNRERESKEKKANMTGSRKTSFWPSECNVKRKQISKLEEK